MLKDAVTHRDQGTGAVSHSAYVSATHLPAYNGHLPAGNLVDALQLALAFVDQAGHVLHGLVGCLDVVVIAAKWGVHFNGRTCNSQRRTDSVLGPRSVC